MPPRYRFAPVADGATSTSVGRARRCTTGRWRNSRAGRSCCGSRTPTRCATIRSGPRASSTGSPGWASVPRMPTFEGPYFQSSYAAAHVAAAERLYEQGLRLLLRSDARTDRGAAPRHAGKPGYDGFSRDRGLGPGPGRVLRFRVPDGETVVDDVIRGAVTFENENLEDFVLLRGNGIAGVRARQRRRRHRDGASPTSCGPRSTCPTRRSSSCCGRPWALPRRCGHTSRCSSTRPARSCRSVATRSPSSRTATTAISPRRWSTT